MPDRHANHTHTLCTRRCCCVVIPSPSLPSLCFTPALSALQVRCVRRRRRSMWCKGGRVLPPPHYTQRPQLQRWHRPSLPPTACVRSRQQRQRRRYSCRCRYRRRHHRRWQQHTSNERWFVESAAASAGQHRRRQLEDRPQHCAGETSSDVGVSLA
jgi:hypothetical protein